MTRYVTPEPMIVPAPYPFDCPYCGKRVRLDAPMAWVDAPGRRHQYAVCEHCACTEAE